MVDKMKGKKVVDINIPYFLEHAEEIINNTGVVLNPYTMKLLKYPEDGRYAGFYHMIEKKQIDSGNWGAFRRPEYYTKPGETENQALNRIDHEYCEATGHWDLFVWEDIPKDKKKLFGIIKE